MPKKMIQVTCQNCSCAADITGDEVCDFCGQIIEYPDERFVTERRLLMVLGVAIVVILVLGNILIAWTVLK